MVAEVRAAITVAAKKDRGNLLTQNKCSYTIEVGEQEICDPMRVKEQPHDTCGCFFVGAVLVPTAPVNGRR